MTGGGTTSGPRPLLYEYKKKKKKKERITLTPVVIIYGLSKFPSHGCGCGAGYYQVLEIGEDSLLWVYEEGKL
jgi:hypothetical protein